MEQLCCLIVHLQRGGFFRFFQVAIRKLLRGVFVVFFPRIQRGLSKQK